MKKRILWLNFCITAAALILFSVVSAYVYYRNAVRHSEEFLRAYMGAFDETEALDETYADALSARLGGARVTFLTHEGVILADTGGDAAGGERVGRPEVVDAIRRGEGFAVRASETVGVNFAYFCKRFDCGLVRISIQTDSLGSIYVDALPAIAVFLVADAVICLIAVYFSTGYMLRPVERLARDAATKKHLETGPELKDLAAIMNRMNDDAEAKMREIEEERQEVVRLQKSKDEFVANITHEMNTPLTSIRGFAELLAAGGLSPEKTKLAAETILTQSERLSGLVESIIGYNAIEDDALPVYEVNATRILKELLTSLAPAIDEKQLEVTADIAEDIVIMSRHERLFQLFGNILRNAIRYNRQGGSISLTLSEKEFICADTGIGIAEKDLGRIFDRFYTADKSHGGKNGGFGLGLSVVKKLCEKSGWAMSVESKEGAGTSFTVCFR